MQFKGKKIVSLLVACSMAVGLLTACGSGGGTKESNAGGGQSAGDEGKKYSVSAMNILYGAAPPTTPGMRREWDSRHPKHHQIYEKTGDEEDEQAERDGRAMAAAPEGEIPVQAAIGTLSGRSAVRHLRRAVNGRGALLSAISICLHSAA
ncbi:hypothetical protein N2384_05670 [Bacillus paralicheniformis]|uniref:hypothetical protein n=1 Tax=Bacillus paralicheniformis TaxID=1648923 RepID=UPI0021A6C426|nr:hypothetical protein [Bacillus paralicheniformis]UWS62552.1 hypothetical protein N2384_05670 [Bacillus paralicheniformis]